MRYTYFTLLLVAILVCMASCKKEDMSQMTDEDPPGPDTTAIQACNGDTSLCNKRYNDVAYATTHNAHASLQYGFSPLSANQHLIVTEQLDRGVRCLNIKTYYTDDSNCGTLDHYLYHGFPIFGCIRVDSFLLEVKKWIEANPNEVVTFTIEGSSSLNQLQSSFSATGYDSLMYQHSGVGNEWPTLGELIDSNKRVVVFTSRGTSNSNYVGFHDYWNYVFGNDYDAQSRTDFECTLDNRGNPNGDLYLLNHFITQTTPQRDSAKQINLNPYFSGLAVQCSTQIGHIPNFVMVDFFGEGDTYEVVKQLNGGQ